MQVVAARGNAEHAHFRQLDLDLELGEPPAESRNLLGDLDCFLVRQLRDTVADVIVDELPRRRLALVNVDRDFPAGGK